MKRNTYLPIFITLIIGLAMGFVLSAQSYDSAIPNHALQQVTTDETGATSVDADANDQIDVSDTVTDIGPNVQMPWTFTTAIPFNPTGVCNLGSVPGSTLNKCAWAQFPSGTTPIPTTAEFAIVGYHLGTGDGSDACDGVVLYFHDSTGTPGFASHKVEVEYFDFNDHWSSMRGQAKVPLIPGTGKFWYSYGVRNPSGAGESCTWGLRIQGYID